MKSFKAKDLIKILENYLEHKVIVSVETRNKSLVFGNEFLYHIPLEYLISKKRKK